MHMVKIFVLDEFLNKLCETLYDFGFIEVRRSSNFIRQEDGVTLLDNENLIKKSDNLKEEVKKVLDLLGIRPIEQDIPAKNISVRTIDEISRDYKEVISKVQNLSRRIKENRQKTAELTIRSEVLNAIEEKGLRLESFKGSDNIIAKAGVVPKDYLKDIKSYKEGGVLIEIDEEFLGNVFVFCLSLREKEQNLLSFLKSVKFKDVSLDYEASSIGEIIESLELNMWQLREESAQCQGQLNSIRKKYHNKLALLPSLIDENERIYKAMGKFLASRTGYVIAGWVPESKIDTLNAKLKDFNDMVYIEKEPAENLIKRGFNLKDVPSYMGHKLLKPFEKIVKFYGVPAYRHIDPTMLMSLSFIVMFGMMFGDLGHGLSLVVLALALSFFKMLKDAAKVLSLCGISGAVFGILFGSCFGKENIFKPLWFNPSGSPEKFLIIGVGFGTVMITLGIILNIVQNARNRNVKEALFSQWGIVSVIFYWLILYVIAASVRYHLNISPVWLLVIFFVPLFIIVSGSSLWRGESDIAEIIFSPVEIVLNLLTNTISFVRVAAFGLAHAALGACVYLVAYNMGNITGIKMSLIIEGNIGIVLFEGLIVFIQALRLEFYEFFSKFFQLQGREFKPLKERGLE